MSEFKIDYCHHDSVTAESRQERISSADVVEVVRCKDCKEYKLWGLDGVYICMRLGSYYGNTKPNDYCSHGERKEQEHE